MCACGLLRAGKIEAHDWELKFRPLDWVAISFAAAAVDLSRITIQESAQYPVLADSLDVLVT
jgi:hypothetical protein